MSRTKHSVGGLSPRMRGNPNSIHIYPPVIGSIPAHAGEPLIQLLGHSFTGVYPRACGGTFVKLHANRDLPGLSPRMRGNR